MFSCYLVCGFNGKTLINEVKNELWICILFGKFTAVQHKAWLSSEKLL